MNKLKITLLILPLLIAIAVLAGWFLWTWHVTFRGSDHINQLHHGRINILLVGIPGKNSDYRSTERTDTLMIVSINPIKKDAVIVSIPRDLWMQIEPCSESKEAKVNAAYYCGQIDGFKQSDYPAGGMGLLIRVLEQHLDIPIDYYIKMKYAAFVRGIDAVGGIDVVISSKDPRGIYDPVFINKHYPNGLKLKNGLVHLDGEQALMLVRARNSTRLGYGVTTDFDRNENQRKVLLAFYRKAISPDTVHNPVKLSRLFFAFVGNVQTNFASPQEIWSLVRIIKQINPNAIQSIGLSNKNPPLLVLDVSPDRQSIVRPSAGLYDFSQIQTYLRNQLYP